MKHIIYMLKAGSNLSLYLFVNILKLFKMSKTIPTVLQSYKRANKERKTKMLLKYGYKTEAGFLKAFSEGTPSTKKEV